MDEVTVKTQIPKCRLYTVSHVGILDPSCELLPLYLLFDLPHSPPSQSKQTVCSFGGGGGARGGVELCCRPYSAGV